MAALPFIVPHWPGLPANVSALSTTRAGGVSLAPYDDGQGGGGLNLGVHVSDDPGHVAQNRALLATVLPAQPAWLNQVHGVAVADAASLAGRVADADASVASEPGVVCLVMTADCLPVLFSSKDGQVVAAAHAGWRGLANGVLQRTVQAMRERGAVDILAWLGPAIGPRQFEVGPDVAQAFLDGATDAAERQAFQNGFKAIADTPCKYLADIYALGRLMLAREGVTQVAGGEYCTVSEAAQFYSYRRDGVTGRQASLIWRK
ncbi:peptidoglycan editing factor PgeF [Janthinobacterium sp. RB2R34]|uniref:peptidoglycan editing factor PgeF n=1 Tax=Janthinobacterium sp. RB2R34 TaxID=3424193 RepID=UPI003F20FEEC